MKDNNTDESIFSSEQREKLYNFMSNVPNNFPRLFLPRITKEDFVKKMSLILNFHSEQETLNVLIDKITDGSSVVTLGNYLIDEIIDMINESLYIRDKELLYWWLYEDVDKVIYDKDDKIFVTVRTLEELYDYIINNN